MEAKGTAAEESSLPGGNGEQDEKIGVNALGGEIVPMRGAVLPADGNEPVVSGNWQPPRVRVDARLLEATLLNLRKRIAAIPLVYDIPGAEEVTAERGKLLSQIDDYLLPRVRESAAPLLVALVGSTGAGKSTLVNSIVGTRVSQTGVRRPTTNSPVLACHPDDIHWFAENMFLPTLPRVRQEGLARPGRDGLLVLAASEGMTKGIALLDTPDIDSVVRAHYDFAYQFLDASDLWLFMTSATRYADAPVWELLQHARERGAALGVVLSRVPPSHRAELVAHFGAMLDANGIQTENRFVIPETGLVDGYLPDDIFQPVRDWLEDTAKRADRRVAVLSQTMSGMLDTFKIRVPRLAAHVDAQVVLRTRLRRELETAYSTALAEFDDGTRGGRLLGGEVLARWQDYTASGDLGTALRGKKPAGRRGGKRARADAGAARYAALDSALRSALQSLVVSVADRAAEQVARVWRDNPGGASLIAAAEATRVRDERAKREFESAFGTETEDQTPARPGAFDRSSPDLPARVSRAVSTWQDRVVQLSSGGTALSHRGLQPPITPGPRTPRGLPDEKARISGMQSSTGATARTSSGATARTSGAPAGREASVRLLALVALLGEPSRRSDPGQTAAAADAAEIGAEASELLAGLIGSDPAAELLSRARADLTEHVGLLLDEELLRFGEVIEDAGPLDAVAAVRLYQAEYSLEAAR
jgi:energy-coupling factor transporter ATP-binding protein EcfA2